MGRSASQDVGREMRDALVEHLKGTGRIRSDLVEAAFRSVPRHLFLPGTELERVYADVPIPIKKRGGITLSGSSQPTIMAMMLEVLELQPGHRVLEIGAGTGYNAALMAEIVGEIGDVVTIELDDDIAARAAECLRTAGYERVRVICADGGYGFAESGPYDRIVLTVGAWDIAPAWHQQLAADGVLLIPLWLRGVEVLVALHEQGDCLASSSIYRCSFQRLRGGFHGPEGSVVLDTDTELALELEDRSTADGATALALLRGPHRDVPSGVVANGLELPSLGVWIALRHDAYCGLTMAAGAESRWAIPWHFRAGPFVRTFGLAGPSGICLLSRGPGEAGDGTTPREVRVRVFGDGDRLAEQFVAEIRAWEKAGRPETERYQLRAYPRASHLVQTFAANERLIEKLRTSLVISCPLPQAVSRK